LDEINESGNIAAGYFLADTAEAFGMEFEFAFFNVQRLHPQKYSESL
jgi:hypothetical protein